MRDGVPISKYSASGAMITAIGCQSRRRFITGVKNVPVISLALARRQYNRQTDYDQIAEIA